MPLIATPFLLVLAACDPTKEGPVAPFTCVENAADLAQDEASPLGVSPQDVLRLGAGSFVGQVVWTDDEPAGIRIVSAPAADLVARYVRSDPFDATETPVTEEQAGITCPDRIEVGVTMAVTSVDGRLDEQLEGFLVAVDGTQASFHHDLTTPNGELDPTFFVPRRDTYPDDVDAWFDFVGTGPGTSSGRIAGQAVWPDEVVPLDIASFTTNPVGG
jgi:hypothetical protein